MLYTPKRFLKNKENIIDHTRSQRIFVTKIHRDRLKLVIERQDYNYGSRAIITVIESLIKKLLSDIQTLYEEIINIIYNYLHTQTFQNLFIANNEVRSMKLA